MKKILLVPAFLLALAAGGCSLDKAYVIADRATYDAFAPAHTQYVEDDADLSDEEKARRLRLLESWKERIEAAEAK